MTPLVRDVMKMAADHDCDPAEVYWFDASECLKDQTSVPQTPLLSSRPPYRSCMVCWEGRSSNYERMRMWVLVWGDDPSEGISLIAWRQPTDAVPVQSIRMIYVIQDNKVHYGSMDENGTIQAEDAGMVLGFVSAWYESLSRRSEAYVPTMIQNFTNRRKVQQGKLPSYEWRTVIVEPVKPRKQHQGGTHASPRLHDRRGHYRVLRSGQTVWVRSAKVGDASKGIVFHDYKIKEKA